MKLTVGRIVLYKPKDTDSPEIKSNGATLLPAVVVRAWNDEGANLKVLTDGPVDMWLTSVTRGDGPGQWQWPNREDGKGDGKGDAKEHGEASHEHGHKAKPEHDAPAPASTPA